MSPREALRPVADVLNMASFTVADLTVAAGLPWQVMGRVAVGAAQGLALGYGGGAGGQAGALGRIYADIVKAGPAAVDGQIRFTANDAQDRVYQTLRSFRTQELRAATLLDRTTWMPLPLILPLVPEDWSLVMWFRGDLAAEVIDVSICPMFVDITRFDLVIA